MTHINNIIKLKYNLFFKKHSLLWQIFKFGLIGAFNFLIDLSIYFILTRFLLFYYLIVHIFSFLVANSISFILNKNFAFRDKNTNNIFIKYIKFLGFTSLSLLISLSILFVSVRYFKIFDIYGKILGTIVAAIFNFISYKFLVFKTKNN